MKMPFQSKVQQGYLFIHHPKVAKEFAKKTTKEQYKKLPEKADSLFKDDVPRKVELSGDVTTLMGNLAKRMASRDYIDKQNLGTQAIVTNDSSAETCDVPPERRQIIIDDQSLPRSKRVSGLAKEMKMGIKEEEEHKDTIKKVIKDIAKDHLKEDPKYYSKLAKI
jgi:hypothetical protein